jgi:hypothetical protein
MKTIFNLSSLIIAIFSVLLFVSTLQASCPTNILPHAPAWTSTTRHGVPIPGTSCTITITFCFRSFMTGLPTHTEVQFYIDEIIPENSDCDGLTWAQLVDAATDNIWNGFLWPDCKETGNPTIGTMFQGTCCEFDTQSGRAIMRFCSSTYCKKTCEVCWDADLHQTTFKNCVYSTVGTPDCEVAGDIRNGTVLATTENTWGWLPNHCYLFGCEE